MNLSPHFTIAELIYSQTASARQINNAVPEALLGNLKILAEGLEQVRALLNAPLHINSGYRCKALNEAVGGSPTSAHMEGFAADFTCAQFGTPLEIVREIEQSGIKFDQCIAEGKWVHISFDPQLRQRLLTAHFDASGKATYTRGLT